MTREQAIRNLIKAASRMVKAYEPTYGNEWMVIDSWGQYHRCSFENDKKVMDDLKQAIKDMEQQQ